MDKQKLTNHFFIRSAAAIDDICAPLKKHFGVTSFVYQKNDFQEYEIRLSNQPEWLEHFYSEKLYEFSQFDTKPDNFQSGSALWSEFKTHQPILERAHEFNIANGITLTHRVPDGVEFYFLGTTPQNIHAPTLFMSNMDLLERFIVYFHDKASALINEAEKHKIKLNKTYSRSIDPSEIATIFSKNAHIDKEAFIEETLIKHYIVDQNTILSQRELDCIQALLQGKTTKEMGEILFISPRTVETHLNAVKEKLCCRTRSELTEKLLQTGFRQDGSFKVLK